MIQACIFCGAKCFDFFEEVEDKFEGRRIGNQLICTGCLDDLKDVLGIKQIEEDLEDISL
jgi:hypothetical protein